MWRHMLKYFSIFLFLLTTCYQESSTKSVIHRNWRKITEFDDTLPKFGDKIQKVCENWYTVKFFLKNIFSCFFVRPTPVCNWHCIFIVFLKTQRWSGTSNWTFQTFYFDCSVVRFGSFEWPCFGKRANEFALPNGMWNVEWLPVTPLFLDGFKFNYEAPIGITTPSWPEFFFV